jgi:Protein of unknown function (DUF2948)
VTDARFEDGADQPLRLIAQSVEDVPVLSALLQDAVFPIGEMSWDRKRRRFAVMVNRFRWEDRDSAEAGKRGYERVQAVLVVEGVMSVRTQGVDRGDRDMVLSVLAMEYADGRLTLMLAGDGAVALDVDALDLSLQDVTRPYLALSGKAPSHD